MDDQEIKNEFFNPAKLLEKGPLLLAAPKKFAKTKPKTILVTALIMIALSFFLYFFHQKNIKPPIENESSTNIRVKEQLEEGKIIIIEANEADSVKGLLNINQEMLK